MPTNETETPAQPAAKRVRIDPTPEKISAVEREASPKAEAKPNATAVASRQEPVRTLFDTAINEFMVLKTKLRQLTSTKARLSEESTIPKSCRFKFNLKASSNVMESAEFKSINERVRNDLETFQKRLKASITDVLDLEINEVTDKINKHLITTIIQLSTLELIRANPLEEPTNNDVHKLCAFLLKYKLTSDNYKHAPNNSFFITPSSSDKSKPIMETTYSTNEQTTKTQ